ncbi:MAG TPA: aminotransferase class V-fold PLP-dependent enzyme [Thermoanaerobaculia bacterium]|nr:aminotransferase class V-fold PLP-dependent enzyme [Thermoanaerobaculia bacterium]
MNEHLRTLRETEFPVIHDCAYLNHAGMGPMPRRAARRMGELAELVSRTGDRRWLERNDEVERVRGLAARLLGAREAREVAFVENTSTALSMVAAGWTWRPGDNVVGAALEFPSNVYPWMQLADFGVEYRRVPERDGRIDFTELIALMDERTRMLALSWVQFASGFRSDLARLGAACRERDVLFVVDVIQGLGALALDVERELVDVAAASSHKWLLGAEGIGILYVSDRVIDRLRPARSGWRSTRDIFQWTGDDLAWAAGAKRFESGTLNVYGIVALGGALEVLHEAGAAAVEEQVLSLTGRAARGLAELGFSVVSSATPGETSGIVTAVHPHLPAGELVKQLGERDVVAAARAGRFRISPHFYNTAAEIDRCLEALSVILP